MARPKDIKDVRGVMKVQLGRLDLDYIRQWTDRHGTRDLFDALLAETQPLD